MAPGRRFVVTKKWCYRAPPARPGQTVEQRDSRDATSFDGSIMSTLEATGGASQGSPAPVSGRPRVRGGFFGWLLVRDELSRARENAARFTTEQRQYLRRAKVAFELGELALAPGSSVRSGSTVPLAADLFRQSLYWALLAQNHGCGQVSSEAVWAAADGAVLAAIAANEAELAQIAGSMRSTFVDLAEASVDTAELLRRSATRLITITQRAFWQLEWSKLKRLLHVAVLAVICLVPLAFVAKALLTKPDLAKGAPWHTSSIGYECHPDKSECGGATTTILFHTKLEKNPWFEYDFGAPLAFSSLTIHNRSDSGLELAVPLIVEVSDDDRSFRELVRRTEVFAVWRPSFSTQHARYLRLRVPRESMLHLEAVQVHP
jgi:hypothetical protein